MRFLFLFFLTLNLLYAQKIALLIGNSNYQKLDQLSSPSQDIPALAKKLRTLGFTVYQEYNLDRVRMYKTLDSFQKRLRNTPQSIGFFYYSGHGSQAKGESYLIPVEVGTQDENNIIYQAIKVEEIANRMASSGTKANILFLDACRNVPTGTKGGYKGLGHVKNRPSGSLIVYSTSKNHFAKDDRLFNQVVLNKLASNVSLTTLANDISYTVEQKTSGSQVPEVFTKSLPPKLCLGGNCTQKPEVKVVERVVYRDRVVEAPVITQVKEENHPNIVNIDGLMYQNQPFTKGYTWEKAKGYCRGLTLGEYSDWRLPTRDELMKLGNIKLYNYDNYDNWKKWFEQNKHRRFKNSKGEFHFIDKRFIENMSKYSWFWTSETYEKDSSDAWGVSFDDGHDSWFHKTINSYALCVR